MKKWDSNFSLGDNITQEQLDFFDQHGVIIFRNFLTPSLVQEYISEITRVESLWITEAREKINGVPLKFGKDEHGNPTIQRFAFISLQCANEMAQNWNEWMRSAELNTFLKFECV